MNWRSRLQTGLVSLAVTLISLFTPVAASFAKEATFNQLLLKHPQPHLSWATWKIVEAQEKAVHHRFNGADSQGLRAI
jgi:hypothetical protein